MPTIEKGQTLQTVITTFETNPGAFSDLLEELEAAYEQVISRQPGFISAALHVNDAQTRIANYSQWRRREDFLAMLR
ncbi:MAG: antibiotic biosynthesis monooxygenase family protein, partial [Pseudomonadota bacterium]